MDQRDPCDDAEDKEDRLDELWWEDRSRCWATREEGEKIESCAVIFEIQSSISEDSALILKSCSIPGKTLTNLSSSS